jgi:hypothetical protein
VTLRFGEAGDLKTIKDPRACAAPGRQPVLRLLGVLETGGRRLLVSSDANRRRRQAQPIDCQTMR